MSDDDFIWTEATAYIVEHYERTEMVEMAETQRWWASLLETHGYSSEEALGGSIYIIVHAMLSFYLDKTSESEGEA